MNFVMWEYMFPWYDQFDFRYLTYLKQNGEWRPFTTKIWSIFMNLLSWKPSLDIHSIFIFVLQCRYLDFFYMSVTLTTAIFNVSYQLFTLRSGLKPGVWDKQHTTARSRKNSNEPFLSISLSLPVLLCSNSVRRFLYHVAQITFI